MFTQRNSSLVPSHIKNDLDQLSSHYVREIDISEIFPNKELGYGESSTLQVLNLSYYPQERGPYNMDVDNMDANGYFTNPQKRWGGIMRKMDTPDFEAANIEYVQFWMLDPFLEDEDGSHNGGDLYFNFGEISEDILKRLYELPHVYQGTYEDGMMTLQCSGGSDNLLNVLHLLEGEKVSLGRIYSERPTLNDVFLEITGKTLRDEEAK